MTFGLDMLIYPYELDAHLKKDIGNSLVIQWLGLCACTVGGTNLILGRELRSHRQHSVAVNK